MSENIKKIDIDNNINFGDKKLIISTMVAGTVAGTIILLMPLYVGALATTFGFSESQLGILASMEIVGQALMSLIAPLWIRRVNWRYAAWGALTWLIICNVVSIYIADFGTLVLVRLLGSICWGVLATLLYMVSSYTRNPDRFISLWIASLVTLQVIGFLVLPSIIELFGIAGFFHFVNLILVLGLLGSRYFPPTGRSQNTVDHHVVVQKKSTSMRPLIILASYLFFFGAQIGLFSFIERLGAESGFSAQDIGFALSLSMVSGFMGAMSGAAISAKFGRLLPLLIGGVAQIGALYLLKGSVSYSEFLVSAIIFQFFWNFPIGFQVGVLLSENSSHRYVPFISFAQASGSATSPAVCGFVLENAGYDGLMLIISAAIVVYLVLILPFAYTQDRRKRESIDTTLAEQCTP